MSTSNIQGFGETYVLERTPLNQITRPTGNLDVNDNLLTNVSDPVNNKDAVNLQYLQANTYTQAQANAAFLEYTTPLNEIAQPIANVNMNTQKLTNLANASAATDAMNQQASDARYYLNTTALNNITTPSANVSMNSKKIIDVANATLDTDVLNRQTADGRYYSNTTTLNNITNATGSLNMNSNKIINLSDATLATDALNRQTGDGRYYANTTTLNNITTPNNSLSLNSNKITNLANATLSTDAINKGQLDADFKSKIQSTNTQTQVNTNTNDITFNIGNTEKLKLYVPSGQATQPCGLIASDKIQFTTGLGSISYNSALPQNQLYNNFGMYLQQPGNDMTKNQNVQFMLQCTNNSGSQQSQALTFATGHIDIGTGMQNYSLIYNKVPDGIAQNLQISAGTPQSDQSINLYSDSYAIALGTNLTCQFTKKVGYSTTTAITENNQFSSKAYVDTSISGLSSVYQTQAAMSNYYTKTQIDTNIYTKTQSDNRFYLNTVTLNNITAPTGSLSLNAQKITGLGDATLATDALNRQTGDARYYLNTVTLNNITIPNGSVALNSQKITGLADATLATDALNRQTGDSRYYLSSTVLNSITAPTGSLSLNSQKITGLGDATLATDALNRQTADSRYYANTTTLNSITAPTGSVSLNSQKITGLANGTLSTDAVAFGQLASYYLATTTLNNITAPTGSVSLNSQKITNLGTPTLNTDASTKLYVDNAIAGVSTSGVPVGTVLIWCTVTIPTGYLLLDGSTYNTTTYAALFAVLGSGTLPDMRGRFPRGYDPTRLVDKTVRNLLSTQGDMVKAHSHGVPEITNGSTNTDAGHVHAVRYKNTSSGDSGQATESSTGSIDGTYNTNLGGAHSHTVTIPAFDTNIQYENDFFVNDETRVKNIAFNFIIRAL